MSELMGDAINSTENCSQTSVRPDEVDAKTVQRRTSACLLPTSVMLILPDDD